MPFCTLWNKYFKKLQHCVERSQIDDDYHSRVLSKVGWLTLPSSEVMSGCLSSIER